MGLLDGRRAVITGGASGIGAATARRMHDEGATVAIVDIDADGAAAVAAEVAGECFVADVADPEACTAAITGAADALGGISVLFNNAGIGAARPLHEYSDRAWAKIVRVNCVSPGFVDTALTAGVLSDPNLRAAVEAGTPLARVGTAVDVANAVVFLASPLA